MADTDTFTDEDSEITEVSGNGSSGSKLPAITLNNAYKIIEFYQEEPQWLSNPRTKIAANTDFAQAAKIIGMSIQIDRVKNSSEAARNRNAFMSAKIKGLAEMSSLIPVDDVNGQTELGRLNGMIGSPDIDMTEFANGVSRLQSKYKKAASVGVMPSDVKLLEFAQQYRESGDEQHAAMLEAIVAERGRNKGAAEKIERNVTVTEEGAGGKKVTRKLTEEEAASMPVPVDQDTAKQLAAYASEKAALAAGDKSVGPDWMGLSERGRKLGELRIKLEQKGINPDTGTRLSTPTTNAPAATTNAPAASSAIPMPSAKTELVPGTRYSTPRGEATWDGEKFVK